MLTKYASVLKEMFLSLHSSPRCLLGLSATIINLGFRWINIPYLMGKKPNRQTRTNSQTRLFPPTFCLPSILAELESLADIWLCSSWLAGSAGSPVGAGGALCGQARFLGTGSCWCGASAALHEAPAGQQRSRSPLALRRWPCSGY